MKIFFIVNIQAHDFRQEPFWDNQSLVIGAVLYTPWENDFEQKDLNAKETLGKDLLNN